MSSVAFEKKQSPNGLNNPKYIDLLDEDKPISGQKFVCVSFVSPENILQQKKHFFFQEFLKHFDFSKGNEKFESGIPESFNVLVKEIRALGLNIELN